MSIDALRRALVALYDADPQVRVVTGRTSGNLVKRGTESDEQTPIATFFIPSAVEPGGTDRRRRVIVQFDVFGSPTQGTTPSDLETLMNRAEALFNSTNLAAQTPTVDASVTKGNRRDNPDDGSIGQDFTFLLAV